MDMNLDLRIEAYLNGTLDAEETRRFEAELARSDVATAFSQALLIRTTFRTPVEVPDDLVDRVVDALGAALRDDAKASSAQEPGTVRAVLESFGWIFRGPSLAVAPGTGRGSSSRAGFATIRYAWAPVEMLRRPREKKVKPTIRRRLFDRLLRRGK